MKHLICNNIPVKMALHCIYMLILTSLARPIRTFNPIELRKAKIVYNFGLSECSRVKIDRQPGTPVVELLYSAFGMT